MSKLGTAIVFLAGAAIGGAAVWYYTRDKYAQLAEEEINSVKEAYAKRERQQENQAKPDTGAGQTHVAVNRLRDKGSITDFARRIQGEKGYTNYSKTVTPLQPELPEEEPQPQTPDESPYVISPDEFGEIEEYEKISLTYFNDGVLSDEYGVVVENVEEIVGDGLDHFGEYEGDSVFVRNTVRKYDYEILWDERKYEEFRKTLPSNI